MHLDGGGSRGPRPNPAAWWALRSHPEDRFLDVLLGETTAWESRWIRLHVRCCASCRRAWEDVAQELSQVLPNGPEGIGWATGGVGSEEWGLRVRGRLMNRVRQGAVRRRFWRRSSFVAGAVVGALALLGGLRAFGVTPGRAPVLALAPGAVSGGHWKPTTVASLTAFSGRAHGVVLLDRRAGRVTVDVWQLPQLPAGDVYEVWWVTRGGHEPAGTFAVDRAGSGMSTVSLPRSWGRVRSVGITREPEPGTRYPTGKRLLGGPVGGFRRTSEAGGTGRASVVVHVHHSY